MKRIRGGSGLGDSIYLRPIIDHFVKRGEVVTALSNYPDVFIGSGAVVEPFRRDRVDVVAHYTAGKTNPNTNQFQDMCNNAGLPHVELAFGWKVRNSLLISEIMTQAAGRPIIVAHGGRAPMARTDGFGMELMPKQRAFDIALAAVGNCFVIGIGGIDGVKYSLPVDLDMSNKTSVADMLDIVSICDGVIAQCSFAVPMAEVFDKPLLAVWAYAGLLSPHPYIKTITPSKIFNKYTSWYVMDDWDDIGIYDVACDWTQNAIC